MNTRSSAAPLLAIFFIISLGSLRAQTLDWEENAQFGIEVGGAPDLSAQVFQPTNYQRFMILTSEEFNAPVLLNLGKKRVSLLKPAVVTMAGTFLKTKGTPKGKDVGKYTVKGGVTTFKVQGKTVTLTIRQTLVGEVPPGIILAHSPDYVLRKKVYKPKSKAVSFLKSYKKKTELVVMFATWCSTCKVVLPRIMRILEDAKNSQFSVRYIGIAMGGSEPAVELERYGHDYPALIVYQNGKEVDRIVGDPPGTIEDAFVNILK
jgi:thiol-disulfide isomerase/thioredoxin